MAIGKRRRRQKQTSMWVATQDLPRRAPFYARLNQILDKRTSTGSAARSFDDFAHAPPD
jgi:hypothetical protein